MPKTNLLLCFDAFGTLFRPKKPIAQQYSEVARSLGLGGFSDEQVQASFKAAFKDESKRNPNYGKANGMNAGKWWTNIIHNTFQPLVGPNQQIHSELAPQLLYRFSSEEGYTLVPGVIDLLQGLRNSPPSSVDKVTVGVITNSDDRVPTVLTSLGLRVSPFKYGSEPVTRPSPHEQYDIDFSVMSYDVGHEKPDKRIFEAAETVLMSLPATAGSSTWLKVYVGDDYHKDVVGARDAGWHAVLISSDTSEPKQDVEWLDEKPPGDLVQYLESSKSAVGFSSLESLAKWLSDKAS